MIASKVTSYKMSTQKDNLERKNIQLLLQDNHYSLKLLKCYIYLKNLK